MKDKQPLVPTLLIDTDTMMTKKLATRFPLSLVAAPIMLVTAFVSHANNISFDQMQQDITYLASDELKGRASFSPEIEIAANYIGKRFADIGLTPMQGLQTFKQTFDVINISPMSIDVKLNGSSITLENLAFASTMKQVKWNALSDTNIHTINATDNMREKISQLNQQGGQHLVLLNTAHKEMFARYQHYFQGGLNKLNLDHQGAIVIVLTDQAQANSIKVSGKTSIAKKQLTNVVGVLPGKQKADEIILFSSHYDHLGVNEKDGKDKIFNGADDDASGTTAIINLAQYFAKQNDNSRTLMFSAFTAEEIGGFGSRYFSQQLDPQNVKAMINIEMIGKPSKFGQGTLWMTGKERSNLGDILNQTLASHKKEIHADPYPEQGLFYRSDNATLARLGVPAHSFSSTQLDKDQHYHQVSDDLASLDLKSMHQVIETLSLSTKSLIDGSVTPTRIDVNKVKAKGKIY